ncbi:IspD/TarI family cytidylyltransferase [Paenibacillus xylanexedens]|uniref:2-C-methyl-D-erythritol 4-phosphate cytidylyltransferase n=1 Tax=Paenibacillus xylanexedens TaxID=528191 RepID=A0ABS4RVR5_PAEXY|nr:IspD/TarI family cytidylyltransferase [Paenibacillus xylanexedens]MBP2246506.1 2-C-methyl-D-erythritol 4-phosphate cytidylyltransferase [Paenibacillus xylanexedens]
MNIALLTASGTGTRTNQDIPKQFIHVDNKPILIYTLEAFQKHPNIDEICVVVLNGWEKILWAYAKQFGITKLKYVINGGSTGQESIYNGLIELKASLSEDDVIIIHDGNRPLVSQEIITDSFVKYQQFGSAVAAIPCTEVVFVIDVGKTNESMKSINRDYLRRTQTPHTYKLGEIYAAHEEANKLGIINMAASCSLMEALGKPTFFSLGSEKNLKISTVEDIQIFRALLYSKNDDWIK